MATSEKPWAVECQNSDESWSEVDSFVTEAQATAVAKALSWQKNTWHRAHFVLQAEMEAIKERTFFVPKPGEEYDSLNGNRHVEIIQVAFDERHPDGYVFYGPGAGEELLSLFVSKYRRTPSKGEAHEPR